MDIRRFSIYLVLLVLLAACKGAPEKGALHWSGSREPAAAQLESFDWLIGTWRAKEHKRSVPGVWFFEDFSTLVAFPYCDYRVQSCELPLMIPLELRHRRSSAEEVLLISTGGETFIWPDRMLVGGNIGWIFYYHYYEHRGREWLELIHTNETQRGSLRVRFEKVSPEYGTPIAPMITLPSLEFPNARVFEEEYRHRVGLPTVRESESHPSDEELLP
jgi:hypothetical protein